MCDLYSCDVKVNMWAAGVWEVATVIQCIANICVKLDCSNQISELILDQAAEVMPHCCAGENTTHENSSEWLLTQLPRLLFPHQQLSRIK